MLRRRSSAGHLHVHQGVLELALGSLFSSHVVKNARKEVSIKHPITGEYLEVDVWYPDINLCFEYQDDHHYQATWYHQKSLSAVQEKDNIKRALLLERGETLILVPCWWDGSSASLQATINFHRPDLAHSKSMNYIIPANPPYNFFERDMQLMLASFPNSMDLFEVTEHNQWWVGEKYDGVRCFWNASEKKLYSRHGLSFSLPPAITSSLPGGNHYLEKHHMLEHSLFIHQHHAPGGHHYHYHYPIPCFDGEIWCGRGLYLEASALVLSSLLKPNWALFRVVCFDSVPPPMLASPVSPASSLLSPMSSSQQFEWRYTQLLAGIWMSHPVLIIATRMLCCRRMELTNILHAVMGVLQSVSDKERTHTLTGDGEQAGGGEGLILRKPHSLYLPGRSGLLLKLKGSITEQKALVLGIEHDGSLLLQLCDGTTFSIPKSDCILYRKVACGDVVAVKYDFNSRRITNDLLTRQTSQLYSNGEIDKVPNRNGPFAVPSNPIVYRIRDDLSWQDVRNSALPIRLFLNEPHQKIESYTVNHIVKHNQSTGKYRTRETPQSKTLLAVADIRNNEQSHTHGRTTPFLTVADRRAFFDREALRAAFDPLVAANWYHWFPRLSRRKEYRAMLRRYYRGKLSMCLLQLYPDIGLQRAAFDNYNAVRKSLRNTLRGQLEGYAASKGANPLVPDFWYTLHPLELRKFKSVHFNNQKRYVATILRLFPELNLLSHKFVNPTILKHKTQAFFSNFALVQGFDPHVYANWRTVTHQTLEPYQGYCYLIKGLPLSDLLMWIYADAFKRSSQQQQLIAFAQAKGGDPHNPLFWYSINPADLRHLEGFENYYPTKCITSIVDLFPELCLQVTEFTNHAKIKRETRKFFINFARLQGFDPLVHTNWYNISYQSLQLYQGSNSISSNYELANLLAWIFPNIGFQKSKFRL